MSDRPLPDDRPPRLEIGLALLALGFFLAVAFQTIQLVREHFHYAAVILDQRSPLENTLKLRENLNALASDIARLAQSGNAAGKQVVDDLARQHIALHTPDQTAPAKP